MTGASGGIGAAVCGRLAACGAAVGVHYRADRSGAERVAAAIDSADGRAFVVSGDLGDPEVPARLVGDVSAALGPVDVLVANAGVGRRAAYEDVDAAMFDEALAVNLRGPYLLARAVLGGMRSRGYGRILFTSSVAAFTGGIVGPHYAASKAGLNGLTHFLASRVAGDGVTVNAIAPALIEDTGMLPGDPGTLAGTIPVRRLGTPAEVADLALAMLSNGYLTNQVVSLDGGLHPR